MKTHPPHWPGTASSCALGCGWPSSRSLRQHPACLPALLCSSHSSAHIHRLIAAEAHLLLCFDVLQLVQNATRALEHSHSFTAPSAQQLQGRPQHRSQREHLADHGVVKLLLSAVNNPWLLALCVMGVLLASASNTYVFFLPMIINALLHGEDKGAWPEVLHLSGCWQSG